MALRQVLETIDLLDRAQVTGDAVAELMAARGCTDCKVETVVGDRGSTNFVTITVPGTRGKHAGGLAPTLGVIGRLGGIGARPAVTGLVSDADGAISAIACALRLLDMIEYGDVLAGDVIVATHICPTAPVIPHEPVPFMDSPVDMVTMNQHEVHPDMDAILSIDTSRGNWIVNRRGFAITPTVKQGYILKVSADLLRIMSIVSGQLPLVLPITTQDIIPYGTGIDHINSIMQPATATAAAVVGVALTSETIVPGCASGASQAADIELAVRFCVEVAKALKNGIDIFYNAAEYGRLCSLYGSMQHLQRLP